MRPPEVSERGRREPTPRLSSISPWIAFELPPPRGSPDSLGGGTGASGAPPWLACLPCAAHHARPNLTDLLSYCKRSPRLKGRSLSVAGLNPPEGRPKKRGAPQVRRPSRADVGIRPGLRSRTDPRALELGPVQVEQVGAGLAAGDRAEHEEELVGPRHRDREVLSRPGGRVAGGD